MNFLVELTFPALAFAAADDVVVEHELAADVATARASSAAVEPVPEVVDALETDELVLAGVDDDKAVAEIVAAAAASEIAVSADL